MKKLQFKLMTIASLFLVLTFTSCFDDLDQTPDNANLLSDEAFFSNPESYKQFLAKLYAGLATTGQQGGAGAPDIAFIDEGFSQYVRGYWNLQELSTDEAIIAWNDATIKDFHYHTWTSSDVFINALFSRLQFQVVNCNEFLRQTSDEKLDSRGVTGELRNEIKVFRAEARFLRALSYWHIIDLFGGASLVTEDSPITYNLPAYATRAELFAFVDEELSELVLDMKAPRTNEQFRVDQAAAWMLKAKLYMNAQVYIGESKYAEALPLINDIIASNYTLHPNYRELFLADNDVNGAQNEFIFAISYDGLYTRTFGGTTYLTHAPVGGTMSPSEHGIGGGWGGIRTTSSFVEKFDMTSTDSRAQFYTSGQSLEIINVGSFNDGYAISKWKNVDVNGVAGSDANGEFVDIDFPMFRLADAYLMYAECAVRGSGDLSLALNYVNALRQRAYGNNGGNISPSDLDLNFIIDERARELHWEGHRRTDLIRFGKFTGGSYIWPWKGGVANGAPSSGYRSLYPIPSNAIAANPNLQQNPGY